MRPLRADACRRPTAYCFPYIVSLMPKTPYLEVHSWQDAGQALVQRIPVEKGASCLCDSIFGTDQEAKGRNPVRHAPSPSSGVDTTLSSPRPRRAAGTPWLTLACLPRRRMCRCSSRCLAR